MSAPAIVFQSISVSNCPDTCDSLHVTKLASDVVPIATMYANISFEILLILFDALHLFSDTPLYDHVVY